MKALSHLGLLLVLLTVFASWLVMTGIPHGEG